MFINEIFGPTIQGEGEYIGTKAIFIRTAGCDYMCEWCDTKHAWTASKGGKMSPSDIFNKVIELCGLYNCSHVVITGGNPAIIGDEMGELIEMLQEQHFHVALETQGSIWQDWMYTLDHLVISPKPPSSGMSTNWTVLGKMRDNLYLNVIGGASYSIKVVVFNDEDYEYAKRVLEFFGDMNYTGFYLQPGNSTQDIDLHINVFRSQLLEQLCELVEKVVADPVMNEVRVLPQLHTLMWGNARGV